MAATLPKLFIIESLDVEDEAHHREGEIISSVLRMTGHEPIYRYVRTKAELSHFVKEFRRSRYRWLHLSVHGNHDLIALTLDRLNAEQFAAIVGPALADGRRLFLSTCKAATVELAAGIFRRGGCLSVAGPVNSIRFGDSAIFWATFYHLMLKQKGRRMLGTKVEKVIATMGAAVGRQFRLIKPDADGEAVERLLPEQLPKQAGKKKK
ncbi:hypothetical protein GCM10009087_04780 [Sphingomonas oligophenolica]|uniref:CHAT domain-containing protein n=1 Tax=Sphingomonas oligophenolica TaxID=301154 RepID=A0ABU9YCA0_9SPHN